MDIRPYEPSMATALTALFNEAVRPVPHSYPVRRATLAAALADVSEDYGRAYRHDAAVWVVQAGTDVVGFVHTAVGRVRRADVDEAGLIRFLWYRPGQRAAGMALLEQAEGYLAGLGATRVVAFHAHHRYPFYQLGSSHLSDRIGHVAALLGRHGYAKMEGEVYLDWRDFAVVEPGPDAFDVRYTVEHPQGAGRRPGVTVRAWLGEQQIGVCVNLCVGDHAPARAAQDWLFTRRTIRAAGWDGRCCGGRWPRVAPWATGTPALAPTGATTARLSFIATLAIRCATGPTPMRARWGKGRTALLRASHTVDYNAGANVGNNVGEDAKNYP